MRLPLAVLTAMMLALAGCGDSAPAAKAPSFAAPDERLATLRRGNSAEPATLDPALADTAWENNIIGDLLMGLYTEDAQGRPIPGAAEKAEVSADGKTWTFTLRESSWSDGAPVTAEDFVYAWRRSLDPRTGGKYGAILYVFKNAKAVAEGRLAPSALGVSAADARTLVLKLEHPAPYLPELLMHNITYPVPKHVVETKGAAWTAPGTYVSNGAYVLKERVPNDHVTLSRNLRFYDAAHVKIDRVVFYPTEDSEAALKRFRAGELDTQEPFPADQIDWLRRNMPAALKQSPTLALDYIVLNVTRKPFDDVRVREALDLALDRDSIANRLYRLGEAPAYSIVPPAIAPQPGPAEADFRTLPYAERVARARRLMQQAGYGPDNRLRTTYATAALPDQRRVAAAIQAMWRAIYVDIDILSSESIVHYAKLRQGDFEIAAGAWSADFRDAANFLMLLTTANPQNYARYSNRGFDSLYEAAEAESDATKRGALLLAAERLALRDHALIPRNFRSSRVIVQPTVEGWVANARDVNRSRWLWLDRP